MNSKKESFYEKLEWSLKKLSKIRPIVRWEIVQLDEEGKRYILTVISNNKGTYKTKYFLAIEMEGIK